MLVSSGVVVVVNQGVLFVWDKVRLAVSVVAVVAMVCFWLGHLVVGESIPSAFQTSSVLCLPGPSLAGCSFLLPYILLICFPVVIGGFYSGLERKFTWF